MARPAKTKASSQNDTKRDILEQGVNDRWRLVIEAIVSGRTDEEAAKVVGVSRKTVNNWKNHNAVFQAELNRRRAELRSIMNDKLFGFIEQITVAITKAFKNPDLPPAAVIQSGLGALPKLYALVSERDIGDSDAAKILRKKQDAQACDELFHLAQPALSRREMDRQLKAAFAELNTDEGEKNKESKKASDVA
jgi:hypothetical protein